MRVLVTGISGYIGAHLYRALSSFNVTGLDKIKPQEPVNKFILHDINQGIDFNEEYDCVIHLAALVNVNQSVKDPISYYITNVLGTSNVLGVRTKNFILASTGSAEYCNNPYGISKKAAEDLVETACKVKGINYTIFRFYNVIGCDKGLKLTNPDGLLYSLRKAEKTGEFTINGNDYNTLDGTCERDYIHVNEVCNAIRVAVEEPANAIECLGHGRGYTVRHIVDTYKKVNKSKFNVKFGPRREGDLESSVLRSVSNYMVSSYSLEQMLVNE